ncbi:MAG TPA: hypothetical protein VGJ73_23060 [Verrucomicrobiae bacterium]
MKKIRIGAGRLTLAMLCAAAALMFADGARAQNVFVSQANGNIEEISPGGNASTYASGFTTLFGMTFDGSGDLFVAGDTGTVGGIFEFSVNGTESTFASGLGPFGLAFDSAGDLFEADATGNINEYVNNHGTLNANPTVFASGISQPYCLAFNSAGDLLVGNINHSMTTGSILEITPQGVQTTFASGLGEPVSLAFNSAGDLFESDLASDHIYEFTPNGTRSTFASGLAYPYGLAFNNGGNLVESDLASGKIYQFIPGGSRSTLALLTPSQPLYVAIQGVVLPVPEPPVSALLVVGTAASLICFGRRRQNGSAKSGTV